MTEERAWKDYFAIYGTDFQSDIGSVASNAGVQSHAVVHFKQDKLTSNNLQWINLNALEQALVEKHGLPYRGFYNNFKLQFGVECHGHGGRSCCWVIG